MRGMVLFTDEAVPGCGVIGISSLSTKALEITETLAPLSIIPQMGDSIVQFQVYPLKLWKSRKH